MKKALKRQGSPEAITPDGLRSYGTAMKELGNADKQEVGAHAVLHYRARHTDPLRCWAQRLIETKPFKLVAVAIANKLARIAYAVMTTGTLYRAANA